MKSGLKLGILLVPLLILIFAQQAFAVAPGYYADPHYVLSGRNDLCNSCHQLNVDGTPKPTVLLKTTIYATCFTCHNGTKANYKVDGGTDLATGTPGFLAAGSSHRVKTETLFQPVLDSTLTTMKLTCVSCHAAHGNSNYRSLKTSLPATTTETLNVYVSLTKPADYATGKDEVVYGTGMDEWCAGCHNKTVQHNGAGGVVRHITNSPMTTAITAIYNAYTYNSNATDWHSVPKVPLGAGVVKDGNGNVTGIGTETNVICMTCHQAHGSSHDKNLLRNYRGRLCMQCHTDSNQEIK